jgi:hypothetical protein
MISGYNAPDLKPAAPKNIMKVIEKCISMHGFILPFLFAKEGLLGRFWSVMPGVRRSPLRIPIFELTKPG